MERPERTTTGESHVSELRFADCDQLSSIISDGDAKYFQLGSGPANGFMMRVDLDGLRLLLSDTPNRTACRIAVRKGIRVVHLPLRWSGSLRWNGIEPARPGVIVWGESCDYYRVGDDLLAAALVIDEPRLREMIQILAPSSQAMWDSFHGEMLADTPQARRLIKQVERVLELAKQDSERLCFPAVRKQLSEQLLLAFVDAVLAQGKPVMSGSPIVRHRARIVCRMSDYLMANPERFVELTDLCRLTNCSARSLAYACETVLETSPMRYLKLLRLNRVRTALRQGTREVTSVSECAYAVGFTHLGYFSADYRKLFGESPKETLNRPL